MRYSTSMLPVCVCVLREGGEVVGDSGGEEGVHISYSA